MADKAITLNHGHRVYLDPDHGLHLPRAEDLADHGVVTASAIVIQAGDTVKAPAGDVDAMGAAGVGVVRK